MGESPDVSLLDHVLGFAVVAQDSAGEPVEPAIVRLHDRANRRFIAAAGAGDQFDIAAPDGVDLWCVGVGHGDVARSSDAVLLMDWMRQSQIGSRAPGNYRKGAIKPTAAAILASS